MTRMIVGAQFEESTFSSQGGEGISATWWSPRLRALFSRDRVLWAKLLYYCICSAFRPAFVANV
eukprot:2918454-Lingulodinium_polyedra.AAC.1